MERIPFDIWINHILPYTYNVQPKEFLEDIQNYYAIKTTFGRYDIEIIQHELVAIATFFLNRQKLDTILSRHWQFQMKSKQFDGNMLQKYSHNAKFKLLFGLTNKEERDYLSEYILTELANWIV